MSYVMLRQLDHFSTEHLRKETGSAMMDTKAGENIKVKGEVSVRREGVLKRKKALPCP